MIPTKSYTLTLDDCVEALLKKKLSPSRALAPGLLLVGGLLALFISIAYPRMEQPPKVHEQFMGYVACGSGLLIGLGALLWRWEGQLSLRRKAREFQNQCRIHLTLKEVSFDDEGWSVRHADGSEDRRKYAHIKTCWEKPGTVTVHSDLIHIFPKRVFSEPELAELKRLCQIECGLPGALPPRRPESVLIAFLGILEYALWRYQLVTALIVLSPILIGTWAFMSSYENPKSSLMEYSVAWPKVVAAVALWYSVALVYNLVGAIRFARNMRYLTFTDAGFTGSYKKKTIYMQWSWFFSAREGATCFLMERKPGSYQLICKRVLSQSEIELLRGKVATIATTAKEAVAQPPVSADHA